MVSTASVQISTWPCLIADELVCVYVHTKERKRETTEVNSPLSAAHCKRWMLRAWQAAKGPEKGKENN